MHDEPPGALKWLDSASALVYEYLVPLYHSTDDKVQQIKPAPFANERQLQCFIEENLEELLGARFIASEFVTGERHGGRIDTLGLDEDGNPVIVEYKGDKSESIINQGLFYLDWLLDHRGDFQVAVQAKLGPQAEISWQSPRLILIASTYTKYDTYAVDTFTDHAPYEKRAE